MFWSKFVFSELFWPITIFMARQPESGYQTESKRFIELSSKLSARGLVKIVHDNLF